jgi:hypothetical protein
VGRRLIEVYPSRALVLGGATMLGLFAIVALVFQQTGVSDERLSLVAGLFAYGFVIFAAIVGVLAWRGTDVRRAHAHVERFLADHATVGRAVGEPVDVRLRPSRTTRSPKGGRLTIPGEVEGPLALGSAETVVERTGDDWQVVSAALEVGERRHELDVG